jgi:hypothetical protein
VPALSHVIDLHKIFGNMLTTTVYSFVETLDVPAFGLITAPNAADEGLRSKGAMSPSDYLSTV